MLRSRLVPALALVLGLSACAPPAPLEPPPGTPRLVLFIVVDQARADYLTRFAAYFPGGIGRLLAESVNFESTRHDHAVTKTAPGHASLVSGVHPARHGIVGNDWYERETDGYVDADLDRSYAPERAPTRLLVSTLGDWMKAAYPPAKVFAASIKSRAAVVVAGRQADGAFWYDDDGRFVSSDYYRDPAPAWLEAFHRDPLPDRLFGSPWEPLPEVRAAAAELDLESVERGVVRGALPRPVGPSKTTADDDYYEEFRAESPFGDEYLGELAWALVVGEELGVDEYPDLLALSFSSLDYIGHRYGPDSPEILDTLVRLDRVIGTLLDRLEAHVGLDNLVVSLSSDHGAPPVPEYAQGRRFWVEERSCLQRARKALDTRFGAARWLAADLVLDPTTLAEHGVESAAAQAVLAAALESCPGVERAWTAGRLATDEPTADPAARLFRHSFHPGRSPDLLLQAEAGAIVSSYNETDHGSLYDYDRHVPWLLRLPSARPIVIAEPVATVDVAPTLAEILGVTSPVGLDGSSRLGLIATADEAARAAASGS